MIRRHVTGSIALMVAVLSPLSPAEAAYECPNYSSYSYVKTVQDLTGAETAGAPIATGVMGNIYAYNRGLTCVAYANHDQNYAYAAVHLHLGRKSLNNLLVPEYVEGGLYYHKSDTDPRPYVYLGYQYVSGGGVHTGFVIDDTPVAAEQWYGFNVSPHTVTQWGRVFKVQYVVGESQTGWTTFTTSPAITDDGLGTPMVRGARTADSNGRLFARQLKYRPTSGWFPWTHMGCYLGYGPHDPSWDVVKFNETSFYTTNQAPEPGGC